MGVATLPIQAKAQLELRRRGVELHTGWPAEYESQRTGIYRPQNSDVDTFIANDRPRYMLLKGGEGGGKSAAGVIKSLGKLRRGMDGIMVSTDLEHFKKSLWPTFREWCPWHRVIKRHQYRRIEGWMPSQAFIMVFENDIGGYSELICGGAKETEIGTWEGPNVNFIHFDEARRHKTPIALKTFDGRARIPGANGEPPQLYLTTTPRKHWLYDYFGPLQNDDALAAFKSDSYVATVLTEENIANLDSEFVRQRAQTLTESEARILLRAEWEDESDVEKFVNIIWWDNCREQLPELGRSEPMVLALDAAIGGETNTPDCFAMIGVTRHPGRKEDVAVRYAGIWQPPPNGLLDFEPIKNELIRLCRDFAVAEVAYDSFQLHSMVMELKKAGVANFQEFSQFKDREIADKQLQALILGRRISHDGNPLLRAHFDNANIKKKLDKDGFRMVKRTPSLKIDAAVSTSMAADRCLFLNLG